MSKNRRNFIGTSAAGIFGMFPVVNSFDFGRISRSEITSIESSQVDPLYPTTDSEDVRKVVGAAHARFDVVQEMVNARPELAKATYDWGFGDWESALGAAAHMGRKDIADYLISKGARPNIFTYAMLGKLNSVKAIINDFPGIAGLSGPHGFNLMHHATMRLKRKNVEGVEKEQQEELVSYLETIELASSNAESLDISEAESKIYLGKYNFGSGTDEFFNVKINGMGLLSVGRGEYFGRSLLRRDIHAFAPGGAPSVRVIFEVVDGVCKSLTIHDPVPILKATKI